MLRESTMFEFTGFIDGKESAICTVISQHGRFEFVVDGKPSFSISEEQMIPMCDHIDGRRLVRLRKSLDHQHLDRMFIAAASKKASSLGCCSPPIQPKQTPKTHKKSPPKRRRR